MDRALSLGPSPNTIHKVPQIDVGIAVAVAEAEPRQCHLEVPHLLLDPKGHRANAFRWFGQRPSFTASCQRRRGGPCSG